MESQNTALELIARFFNILAEPNRLKILCSLRSGSQALPAIAQRTGLRDTLVMPHLQIMLQAKIIRLTMVQGEKHYAIHEPAVLTLCNLVYESLTNEDEFWAPEPPSPPGSSMGDEQSQQSLSP